MRKSFILSLLAMMIAWGIGGCGGGVEGTSADPLGTDSITSFEASDVVTGSAVAPAVTIRGSLLLKATVLSAEGNPVIGREVSFGLVSNASGATLSSINANTGSTGEASIIYTAGMTAGFDVVRVSISNGSTLITNITVGGGTGSYQMTLAADNTSLAAGQTAIITATVTDGSNNPTVGITVTFTLPVNESGASFSDAGVSVPQIQVPTDASGNAVAIYKAGSNDSLAAVYDTVRGALANGSSNAVSITRSAEIPPTPVIPLSIAVAASPASVSAGQVSIVTATLTGDDNAGVTVTFSLSLNNSGATLSASSAVTDGAGNAVVTYTAGATNPTASVSDTVRAAAGSMSSTAVITRTGTAATSYTVTVSASPTTLTTDASNSIITANVKNNLGTAVSGVTVTFTVSAAGGSVAVPGTATTNASGNAVITFTGGPGARAVGDTDVVTATITVSAINYTGNVVITYP